MIDLLQKEISDCLIALQQPNRAIDNYRCYWEGRKALAEELLLKLQQCNVVGSGDGFPDENEEDYYEPEPECHICGKVDGHHSGCPEDNSPYAQLLRDGYD